MMKNTPIDYFKEYVRLYKLFYETEISDPYIRGITIERLCDQSFLKMPFRGTCIDLKDFNETHDFCFEKKPSKFDISYLIEFCEYSYNLTVYSQIAIQDLMLTNGFESVQFYLQQVKNVIDGVGYMSNNHNSITDFVPRDQTVITVAEKLDSNLSYKLLEYNHHSMEGDVERKKDVLFSLAGKLESKQKELRQVNASFESDLFFLFNSMNIRHNNVDQGSKSYKANVSSMSAKELEGWYDDIYQMCLLAFMELEQVERKERIKKLKDSIQ